MSKKLIDQVNQSLYHGRHQEARDALAAYAQNNPMSLQHYMLKGLAEIGLSDWKNAAGTLGNAVTRFHSNHELWAYLGLAQQNLNLKTEAMASFEKSFRLNPGNGVAASNLANLYREHGRFAEAEHMAHMGAHTHPDRTWALNILGLALAERGKFEEARKIYEQALEIEPGYHHALYNLANLHVMRRDFDSAWPLFAKAQQISPDVKMVTSEAMARMLCGDYEKGWTIYEKRLDIPGGGINAPPIGQRYTGQDLRDATLAIIAEQGFGDNLHFCRFGPLLDKMGASLKWVVSKPLKRLFAASFPGEVFAPDDGPPQADYFLPMLSLPLATNHLLPESWPKPPYLKAGIEPALPPSNFTGPRIGLIWAGSSMHVKDHHRSMPLAALAPLFASVRAQFYAPFLSDKLGEITDEPIIRLDHLIKDFADTAALMKQMDCIITVDTGGAHLAGALGLTTYLMLDYSSEWRWGLDAASTPWYPAMKILRQKNPGDWNSVVQELIPLFNNPRAPH